MASKVITVLPSVDPMSSTDHVLLLLTSKAYMPSFLARTGACTSIRLYSMKITQTYRFDGHPLLPCFPATTDELPRRMNVGQVSGCPSDNHRLRKPV
ncbi:hypothetical protein PGT21_031010 [Puccinia graminis f. sp. tritici]|uniref:Uncharacterized protein n=1 Tax=Puccinia graminis f. sp. tritici TaxID=56615 RepID=A0A5B0QKD3_PUCGR|nr:hypothetical protein PGT21_031010 [Puccinia graminis f. sp. tritici]